MNNIVINSFSFNPPATIINNDITAINYVGNWQPQYDIHVPNTSGPYWTKYTNSSAAYFTFEFTGSAVLVYGSSNNDHSRYSAVSQLLSDPDPQEVK